MSGPKKVPECEHAMPFDTECPRCMDAIPAEARYTPVGPDFFGAIEAARVDAALSIAKRYTNPKSPATAACGILAAEIERLRAELQALRADQVAAVQAGNGGAIAYDLSPAAQSDSAISKKLIQMGWASPAQRAALLADLIDIRDNVNTESPEIWCRLAAAIAAAESDQ